MPGYCAHMQWWNDFLDWFYSEDGQSVLVNAVLPFLAILVAGSVAALIGRGSTKRLLTLNDRENRVAAVATMIGAARRASVWNTLSAPEQQHADHVASEADVRVRLLAVPGSGLAADWAAHEIASMKTNSVSFSFQAEQSLIEFRDRMVTWQAKPHRAKKLFKNDLDLWAYEDSQATNDIVSQQQAWAAAQVASETGPISTVKPSEAETRSVERTNRPAFAPPAVAPASTASAPTATSVTETSPASDASKTDGEAASAAPSTATREAPALVEPPAPHDPDDSDDDSHDEEDTDRRLEDAIYSPPVTAHTVTKRINPPTVGDDGRKY